MKKVLAIAIIFTLGAVALGGLFLLGESDVLPEYEASTPTLPPAPTAIADSQPSDLTIEPVESVSDSATTVSAPIFDNTIAPTAPSIETLEDLLTHLLPPASRAKIVSLGTETDGIDGTLAYVEPVAADGTTWRLVYDPTDTYQIDGSLRPTADVVETLVHEYAHILMLNHTQVDHTDPSANYIECDANELIVDEGCASADSYIAQFINEFWNERDQAEALAAFEAGDEEEFAYELFTERPGTFVSEYAATDPIEDAAESFMYFVLQPTTVSGRIANNKIQFFAQFPELVELQFFIQSKVAALPAQ